MMGFSQYSLRPTEHKKTLCSNRVYTLLRGGLHKTCTRATAISLLRTGEWYDATKYQPKEEVLKYEKDRRIWIGNVCEQPEATSEREEPKHQQCDSNQTNDGRKEHANETVRTGSANSEVKKRGRPKRVVN